ncbi:MAG: hypothetical protein IKQ15_08755 [Kiritimatiellae bacterium]|nr:hypothetical protein [Kiritimatiellia bacterium]
MEALSAEQKKLDSGPSTPFLVLQLQRDLTTARQSEIAAASPAGPRPFRWPFVLHPSRCPFHFWKQEKS